MKYFRLLLFFLFIALSFMILQCANPVMPTGGERDIEPPRVVASDPPNFSTNFNGKSISLTFNEFVSLKGIQQQLLISPPLEEKPEFRLRGRTLQIRFDEELKPETTYSMYFGDAIVDLTEGNPLTDFSFVFSTGPLLDSMSMSGNMRFAFDLKPPEDAFVLLYMIDNDTIELDSLPYLVKPYYVARADKEGDFRFNNLRNQQFKIFGLTDRNSNFIYDMAGEAIAFLDSLVTPAYFSPLADSVLLAGSFTMSDTARLPTDTISVADNIFVADTISVPDTTAAADSVYLDTALLDSLRFEMEQERRLEKAYYNLRLFNEVDSTQRLLRAELAKSGLLQFSFRFPAKAVSVEPLKAVPDTLGLLKQYSKQADTLYWYFRQDVLDSLSVVVQFDTLINDTLHLSLKPRQSVGLSRREQRDEAEKPSFLNFTTNAKNRRLEVERDLIFSFDYPVVHMHLRDSTRFTTSEDTTYNSISFVAEDSIGLRYRLQYKFEPEGTYGIYIPDSSFYGLNGSWNDTIDLSIRVPAFSDYGNLFVELTIPPNEVFIIQLLNSQGNVLREQLVSSSGPLSFTNLQAGKYGLKAIQDTNRNGRWDTGDYLKGIQPERVFVFQKEIEVRANWDFEEDWEIAGGN
jgi:hypothetical protein